MAEFTPLLTNMDPLLLEGNPLGPEYEESRWQIREIYSDIYQTAYTLGESPAAIAEAAGRLLTVESVVLLSPLTDFKKDEHFRCAEYTFGYQRGEPWAMKGWTKSITPELWEQPFNFLPAHGYMPVSFPEKDDVIAYGGYNEANKPWIEHFGTLVDPKSSIIDSKLGQAPIALHNINVISQRWGDRYWFFRKS